jgi:methyltransferase (TIGR00027 family)
MLITAKRTTARRVAFIRALETHRPAGERLCSDPYAKDFLSLTGKFFTMTSLGRRLTDRLATPIMEGALCFLPLRTRLIDDHALACAKDGFGQLVILGAGFDTRAYRLAELQSLTNIFELDLGANQEEKLAWRAKRFGSKTATVTHVPVDFEEMTLEQALLENGFRRDTKTLFIWEGVSYFLEPEAVDQTLAFIAIKAAPGSSVVFDCLRAGVIDGSSQDPLAKKLMQFGARIGEPYKFGIEPESVNGFLSDRGFTSIEHFTFEQCKQMYYNPSQQDRKVLDLFFIVKAATGNQAGGEVL